MSAQLSVFKRAFRAGLLVELVLLAGGCSEGELASSGGVLPSKESSTRVDELNHEGKQQAKESEWGSDAAVVFNVIVPIFSECLVATDEAKFFGLTSSSEVESLGVTLGTGVMLRAGDSAYFMTPRHVVSWGEDYGDFEDFEGVLGESQVVSTETRVAIGTIGVRPIRVFLNDRVDLALLQLSNEEVRQVLNFGTKLGPAGTVRPFKLVNTNSVQLGFDADVSGFSSSPNANRIRVSVSDKEGDFIYLTGAAPEGFSGAPCFSGDSLLGLAIRSEEESFTALSAEVIIRELESFEHWSKYEVSSNFPAPGNYLSAE